MSIINKKEMREASIPDLNAALQELSEYILEKSMDSDDIDVEDIMINAINSDDIFPRMYMGGLKKIWPVDDNTFIIPSQTVAPSTNRKKSMVVTIRRDTTPTSEEWWIWDDSAPTFIDTYNVPDGKGRRTVCLHTLTPGMMVIFHNYETVNGTNQRVGVEGYTIESDENGNLSMEPTKENILRKMPLPTNMPKEGVPSD